MIFPKIIHSTRGLIQFVPRRWYQSLKWLEDRGGGGGAQKSAEGQRSFISPSVGSVWASGRAGAVVLWISTNGLCLRHLRVSEDPTKSRPLSFVCSVTRRR